jgi:hypothetical protein
MTCTEYGPYETVIIHMLNTLRVMLLSALPATSAAAAGASAPQGAGRWT